MRIRKRQVPLPLSSLIPVPLSDLYLNRSPAMQLPLHSIKSSGSSHRRDDRGHHQPSDGPIGGRSNGCDLSDRTGKANEEDEKDKYDLVLLQKGKEKEDREEDDDEESNKTSKNSDSNAEILCIGSFPRSGSSPQDDGRWREGEKVVPLKKRRGMSFEEDTRTEKDDEKTTNATTKTKMNKKCMEQKDDSITTSNNNMQEEKKETEEASEHNVIIMGEKKGRGGVLMEGSRCSRVNGRGWRCCQQTLVGYSLCEHHLGKGRVRSMTSVGSRSSTSLDSNRKNINTQKNNEGNQNLQENGENDEKISVATSTKKRLKLGIVKARSISSLLGQTSNGIVALADHDDDK